MKNNRFFRNKETEEIYNIKDLENFYNENKSDFPEFENFNQYLNYYLEYDLMEEIFSKGNSNKKQYANITDNIFLSVSSLLNYKADLYIQENENLIFYKSIQVDPCISFKDFEKLIKEAV